MEKIPTLFNRDPKTHEHCVIGEVRDDCKWVLEEFGIAMEKLDGENCLIKHRVPWRRQRLNGEATYTNASYVACNFAITGDKPYIEGYQNLDEAERHDGIYEALGPDFKGNPYGLNKNILVPILPPRADIIINEKHLGMERSYRGLLTFLERWPIEGIVFKHPDGRMAKVKRQDYGLKWPDPARLSFPVIITPGGRFM